MEDVVIAGIAGKLPESENLQEFWENLLNGVDMVTEDDRRWKPGECLLPLLLELWAFQRNYPTKGKDLSDAKSEFLNSLLIHHQEIQEQKTSTEVLSNAFYSHILYSSS